MGHNFARDNRNKRKSRRLKNGRKIWENYTDRLYKEKGGNIPLSVYKVLCQKKLLAMIMSYAPKENLYTPRKLRKIHEDSDE